MQDMTHTPPRRERGRGPDLPTHVAQVVDSRPAPARMQRVVLALPDGADLTYRPGQALVVLVPLGDGTTGRRDYTIRAAGAGHVTIDVLRHGPTPGPQWATTARPGDRVTIRGPRGRLMLDPAADWHLMTGDETCIPAILHMIETAPAGHRIIARIEIGDPADQVAVASRADLDLRWIDRNGAPAGPSGLMAGVVAGLTLPPGDGRACIIGETSNVRRQRHDLIARGLPGASILSEGYWRPGRIGGHDHVDD
ncbi:NADPH-dependent ferric siderophore reductase, contains FAD-binding and SIP domains [Loktanella fryxellensis]|uniref:NADPH-dependent ferric siderophore reductase, contains FAD-binding and SIP domains n=1 Tax=Loktanella fryxellensis TaxID=245187 RepID=A0A1H8IQU7_9RHOB|nr:siderophore-interacting protein [Loktanella fryxellensis]SEN70465.1 NADPH-dependent ferric siderophore reductase, contains FAD-binding and SIP domains [Loktanella fryxellensis]